MSVSFFFILVFSLFVLLVSLVFLPLIMDVSTSVRDCLERLVPVK